MNRLIDNTNKYPHCGGTGIVQIDLRKTPTVKEQKFCEWLRTKEHSFSTSCHLVLSTNSDILIGKYCNCDLPIKIKEVEE